MVALLVVENETFCTHGSHVLFDSEVGGYKTTCPGMQSVTAAHSAAFMTLEYEMS